MHAIAQIDTEAALLPVQLRKYYSLLAISLQSNRPELTPVRYRGLRDIIRLNLQHCSEHLIDPTPFIGRIFPGGEPGAIFWNALTREILGTGFHQRWLQITVTRLQAAQVTDSVIELIERRCHSTTLNGAITYSDASDVIARFCKEFRSDPDWHTMDERCQISRILLDHNDTAADWPVMAKTIVRLAATASQPNR